MESPVAITDSELLRAWSVRKCQASFRALVEKYLGLVQGVALRRTGDASMAGDIAQVVFTRLAAKASRIAAHPTLAPWLHHCAWCEATSALRRSSSRQRHMNAYADHLHTAGQGEPNAALDDALPHLDAALQALPLEDQRIVLMHHFEGRGLRDIAAALGKTEAAVRKQGQRALEKLAKRLRRGGVGISGTALVAGIGAILSQPASAAAVAAISTSAVAGGAHLTLLDHVLTLMNTKTKTALITAAAMAVPLAWQWQRTSRLEQRLLDGSMAEVARSQIDIGVIAESHENAGRGGVGEAKRPRSLQDLRNLLSERSSRRQMAALWRQAEGMPLEELRRLFLEAVTSEHRDWQINEIAAVLLERLGQADPQTVAALIKQLDVKQVAGAMARLLPNLAAVDPKVAFDLYQRLDAAERAAIPADEFLEVMAGSDLRTATELVAMLEPQSRGRGYGIITSSLSAKDPASAITFLKSLSDADLAGGLGDLDALGRIATFDPLETAQLIDRLPRNNRAGSIFARLAETWVTVDPDKALAWVNGIEFEAIRSQSLESLYRAWAKEDRGKAFEALDEIQDGALRRKVFGDMAGEVIAQDPKSAVEWARRLEGQERSFAFGLLGSEVATRDPELAAEYFSEAIKGGGTNLAGSSENIGFAYALQDPAAAGKWAMGLPVGDLQQHAVEGVARALTTRDPVAASEWVATLPQGDARNGAIYYLVHGIQGADPASAFRWAGNVVDDPEKRLYLLQVSTDSWTKSSPDEARVAIENLALPASEKASLLRRLQY